MISMSSSENPILVCLLIEIKSIFNFVENCDETAKNKSIDLLFCHAEALVVKNYKTEPFDSR